MSDTFGVQIPIEIVDRTAPLGGIAQKVSGFQAVVDKTTASLAKFNGTPASPTITVRDKATAVIKSVARELGHLAQTAIEIPVTIVGGALSAIKSLLGMLTSPLGLLGGAAGIGGLVAWPLSLAANLEQSTMAFGTLMRDGAAATKMLSDLNTFSMGTPYTAQSIRNIGQALLGVKFTGAEVIPIIKAAGDAAAALGLDDRQFQSISQSFVMMKQMPFMGMGDLRAIQDQGIPILDALGKQFGVGAFQMQKMIETGYMASNIMIPKLQAALEDLYGGGLDKMQHSLTGLLTTVKDTFNIKFITAWGQGLQAGAETGIQKLVDWFANNATTVDAWSKALKNAGTEVSMFVFTNLDKLTQGLSALAGTKGFDTMSLGEKIHLVWDDVIVKPFNAWWKSTGEPWAIKTGGDIGHALGSFVGGSIAGLLGLNLSTTNKDGKTIGGEFAKGFFQGLKDGIKGVDVGQILIGALLGRDKDHPLSLSSLNFGGWHIAPGDPYNSGSPVQSPSDTGANIKKVKPSGPGSVGAKGLPRLGVESDTVNQFDRPGPGSDIANQFDFQTSGELSARDAATACGPTAALAFGKANGRMPTIGEAMTLAKSVGWDASSGMPGVQSELDLLAKMGTPGTLTANATAAQVQADVANGAPTILSTPKHYFVANQYDAQTGKFHVGGSGTAMRNGSAWMSWDSIVQQGGGGVNAITQDQGTGGAIDSPKAGDIAGWRAVLQSQSPNDLSTNPAFINTLLAGGYTESGLDPTKDQVGGNGHGFWQFDNTPGSGAMGEGLTDAQLHSQKYQAKMMIPLYADLWRSAPAGMTDAERAVWVMLHAERPLVDATHDPGAAYADSFATVKGHKLGGTLYEPVLGVGQATGARYSFAEGGPEDFGRRNGGGGGGMTFGDIIVNVTLTGVADPKAARAFASQIADPLMAEIAKRATQASFNTVSPL